MKEHLQSLYLNIVKSLWLVSFKFIVIYLKIVFIPVHFQQLLLQSLVSHDHSEIILILYADLLFKQHYLLSMLKIVVLNIYLLYILILF